MASSSADVPSKDSLIMAADTLHRLQRITNLLKLRVNIRFLKDRIDEGLLLAQELESEIERIERHQRTHMGDTSNRGLVAQFNIMPGCRQWIRELNHDALLERKWAELVAIRQALAAAPRELERHEDMLKMAHAEGNINCGRIRSSLRF